MTILAATDLSESSEDALRLAAHFAVERGESLLVVTILEELGVSRKLVGRSQPEPSPEEIRTAQARAREHLRMFTRNALEGLVTPDTLLYEVLRGAPTQLLVQLAREREASLVVVGTVGRSALRKIFLGRTANQLVRYSDIPVLLVPPDPDQQHATIQRILAPIDRKSVRQVALGHAARLAEQLHAELLPMHAYVPPPPSTGDVLTARDTSTQEHARIVKREVLEVLEREGVDHLARSFVLQRGSSASSILKAANEHGADLICMGSHGRHGARRVVLGNTAEKVIGHTMCPLLVIPIV